MTLTDAQRHELWRIQYLERMQPMWDAAVERGRQMREKREMEDRQDEAFIASN